MDTIIWLMGIFIPLYFTGYVWLITVARSDKPLYFFIESRIYHFVLFMAIAEMLAAGVMAAFRWNNEGQRNVHITLCVVFVFIAFHAFISRGFFRGIADLPPLQGSDHSETLKIQHEK